MTKTKNPIETLMRSDPRLEGRYLLSCFLYTLDRIVDGHRYTTLCTHTTVLYRKYGVDDE